MPDPGSIGIELRPANADDMNFVYSSWLSSVATGEKRRTPKEIVYKNHREIMARALNKSYVLIACMHDHKDQILGWLCYEDTVLHYVYVKQTFRKHGVASMLVNHLNLDEPYTVTHWSWRLWDISKTHKLVYNPYLLMPTEHIPWLGERNGDYGNYIVPPE